MRGHRPGEPAERETERPLGVRLRGGIRQALVEWVEDVHAEGVLDLDAALGGEQTKRAVDVRAEFHALFAEPSELRQAEDLEAPGVRENGPVPSHEAMEAAQLADHLVAGT